MDVFDIIGPIMIGPSSSHTAGAVRLGRLARAIFGDLPQQADIYLHGSFAKTYKGHGTDVALVAGLLGLATDDVRIARALELARAEGISVNFWPADLGAVHPNTALIVLAKGHKKREVRGSSIGGGNVAVTRIDEFAVDLRGEFHTILATYLDQLGMVAKVSALLAKGQVNIAQMKVSRVEKGAQALMVVETDNPVPAEIATEIRHMEGIQSLLQINPI